MVYVIQVQEKMHLLVSSLCNIILYTQELDRLVLMFGVCLHKGLMEYCFHTLPHDSVGVLGFHA